MARSSNPANVRLWQARFKQYRDSHLTIAQFCKFIGCSVATFYYWKQRIQSEQQIAVAPTQSSSLTSPSKSSSSAIAQPNFLPVVVANRPVERVSIRLSNGTLIHIPCAAMEAIHAVLEHVQRVA